MASPRKPPEPLPSAFDNMPAWIKSRLNQYMFIAGALAALLYLFGLLKPVVDSGPMPFPARQEVIDSGKAANEKIDTLQKALTETLETAKTANAAAQQALTQTSEFRLDRLLTTKAQLEDQIRRNPNDLSLRTALAHTELDIQNIPMAKK